MINGFETLDETALYDVDGGSLMTTALRLAGSAVASAAEAAGRAIVAGVNKVESWF